MNLLAKHAQILINNMKIFKKLIEIETQAKEYGFYWPDTKSIIEQINSEILEIEELLQGRNHAKDHLQEEIGDLLHAVFSLCVYCNFDPQTTLDKSLKKFEKRFNKVKELAAKDGLKDLHNKSIEESMQYWSVAKK